MNRSITLGSDISEDIFIEGLDNLSYESVDHIYEILTRFCVDTRGNVRKALGFVSYSHTDKREFDPEYVPCVRYEVSGCPWNSHGEYITITLPNPAIDFDYYKKIRDVFIKEIERRINIDLRKSKQV